MSSDRKKIDKIYSQINKLAMKGKDYLLDYSSLVEEIVIKGDIAHFQMCLADYYNIDTDKFRTLQEIKIESWKSIIFQTDSSFIDKMRRLYKKELIYQQGFQLRSDNPLYANYYFKGPYLPHEVTIVQSYSGDTKKTLYVDAGTTSQISVSKHIGSTYSSIDISLLDENVYQIDINKVVWATFSTPDFTYVVSEQSAIQVEDLVIVRLKELDELGGMKDGGSVSTVSLRIKSIYNDSVRNQFIGAVSGDRFRVNIFGIYRDGIEIEQVFGIHDSSLISPNIEANILEVRKPVSTYFESLSDISKIGQISSGTHSSLSMSDVYPSGIPMDHGADYLLTVHRRGVTAWISSTASETYSYRLDVRKEDLLGVIKEVDSSAIESKYFYMYRAFALYQGVIKTYLEVQRAGSTQSITVIYDNHLQSEDSNLFHRYRIAIEYLNS